MNDVPIARDPSWDSSIAFLREGYTFVSRRCEDLGSDVFQTRIMMKPVICMRGAEAAEIFYGGGRFTRQGAMPRSVLHLLQDEGSVQSLDGAAHRLRKQMFMNLMRQTSIAGLVATFAEAFQAALPQWYGRDSIVLHREARQILTRAGARWAGIPLDGDGVRLRAEEFGAMIEQAGSIGPRNWWARRLRNRSEAWARSVIEGARSGLAPAPESSALSTIASHIDADGRPLDARVAAVELLNVLRPIVAVGRFIVFAALALLQQPRWRDAFAEGQDDDLRPFVQEVRRFYPFFPVVGGRVREVFTWSGHRFDVGCWVLLDLYGTNHHPALWHEPETFRPERFRDWTGNPFTLIPQGAGDHHLDHRCPGEWMTIALMEEAVRILCRDLRYTVPVQDLSVSLSTMPALPKSGFVMSQMSAST